jgi:hypothetical protein
MFHRIYLTWVVQNVDTAGNYLVYRVHAGNSFSYNSGVQIGSPTARTFVDTEELPNNETFTYWARVNFTDNSKSGVSNFAIIKAVDDAPVAINDAYTAIKNTPLIVNVPGVLGNDTDDDTSPLTGANGKLRAVIVQQPAHGTLTLNLDAYGSFNGSFTYTPVNGFSGPDTFTYKTNDGRWPRDPTVPLNSADQIAQETAATVRITVTNK